MPFATPSKVNVEMAKLANGMFEAGKEGMINSQDPTSSFALQPTIVSACCIYLIWRGNT